MTEIEQHFLVCDMSDSPLYYLGNDFKQVNVHGEQLLHVSNGKYTEEVLQQFQNKHGQVKKHDTPMSSEAHPELDNTPLLDIKGQQQYQHIIGTGQWLIIAGRSDINYAISSLSPFFVLKANFSGS